MKFSAKKAADLSHRVPLPEVTPGSADATIQEFCAEVRCAPATAWRLINAGDVEAYRFGAAILEGWPALYLDNLKSSSFLGHRDVTLTKLVTDAVFSGRILGMTQLFKGPAGLTVVATGNNIVTDGDMNRRVIGCRLKAPEGENLALRRFKHPSLARWTLENRSRILGALQTILQCEAKGSNIGGFPEWSALVARPILQALDIKPAVFFQPWLEAAEEDAKGVQMPGVYVLARAIAALRTGDVVQPIEGEWFTATEIITRIHAANAGSVLNFPSRDPHTPNMLDAKSLGYMLKRNDGAVYDGDEGRFRIEMRRMNLGARTDRKVKPVYRIKRYTPTAPGLPNSLSVVVGGPVGDFFKRQKEKDAGGSAEPETPVDGGQDG